eukprot:580767-Amphidinium_carterae.1
MATLPKLDSMQDYVPWQAMCFYTSFGHFARRSSRSRKPPLDPIWVKANFAWCRHTRVFMQHKNLVRRPQKQTTGSPNLSHKSQLPFSLQPIKTPKTPKTNGEKTVCQNGIERAIMDSLKVPFRPDDSLPHEIGSSRTSPHVKTVPLLTSYSPNRNDYSNNSKNDEKM